MLKLKVSCPKCNHVIYRGTLGFGPNTVQCKKCGNIIGLDITPWNQLSLMSKIGNILKEILAPSFLLGIDSAMIRFLLLAPACWMLFAFPFSIPILIFSENSSTINNSTISNIILSIFTGLMIFGFFVYPIYLIKRIIKIVLDSSKYEKKSIYPVW